MCGQDGLLPSLLQEKKDSSVNLNTHDFHFGFLRKRVIKFVRTLILIAGFKLVLLWVLRGMLQKSKKSRWQSTHEQGNQGCTLPQSATLEVASVSNTQAQ